MPLVRCALYTLWRRSSRRLDLSKLHAGRVCRGLASCSERLTIWGHDNACPRDVGPREMPDGHAGRRGPAYFWLWLVGISSICAANGRLIPSHSYGWSVPFLALFLSGRMALSAGAGPGPAPLRVPYPGHHHRRGRFCCFRSVSCPKQIPTGDYQWSGALAASGFRRHGIASGRPALAAPISAFPFCFLLVGLPWPVQTEQFISRSHAGCRQHQCHASICLVSQRFGTGISSVGAGLIGIRGAVQRGALVAGNFHDLALPRELYSFSIGRRIILS